MNMLNLSLANIRSGRSAAISLFIFILIAALLLNIGMTIMTQMNTFYDEKATELQDAHANIVMSSEDYKPAYEDFLRGYTGIHKTEIEPSLLLKTAKFRYDNSDMGMHIVFLDADADRAISPLKLTDKLDSAESDNAIYMPYSFQAGGGYALGDPFVITYKDIDYSFRIAGFFETTMLGTNNMGMMKFFLSHASYAQLSNQLGEQANGMMMSAILSDHSLSESFVNDFNKRFSNEEADASSPYWIIDIETAKRAGTITTSIVAMILVAFAIVIVLVSLIVIKFRVSNDIEDGMTNIGALKAVGYTSRQILVSIVMQFMFIACTGGVAGTLLSYLIVPQFAGVISSLSGLIWFPRVEVAINLISIFIVVTLVLLVVWLSAWRIKNLLPVSALRGGIAAHSFRKNFFPLDKAKGGLHFLLACKTMLANRKQNIAIGFILAAVTFASVFAIVLYYNIGVDRTAFVQLVGVETSDVMVVAQPETDKDQLRTGIQQMEGVTKVALLDLIDTKIDGQTFYTNVSDDYSQLENNTVYKGRFPQFDNEISISWLLSNRLHKGIGDTVEVELGQATGTYLVTGLSQSINNMGLEANLTLAGVQLLMPDYTGMTFNVYLDAIDNTSFINSVKEQYGDMIGNIIDVEETMDSQTSAYTSVVFVIMTIILTVTLLVVALILYLVIKTMILKRKKEFGILKATGYTTLQLMHQIALSFVPIVIAGVIFGSLLGLLCINPLLSVLLSGAGIQNAQFTVHVPWVIMLSIGLIILAYLVSMLVSRRIRSISAYELIIE